VGGGRVDTFIAERCSQHQIARHNSRCKHLTDVKGTSRSVSTGK
jgi:hypothetical protein